MITEVKKDWGVILLCLGIVMLSSYILSQVSCAASSVAEVDKHEVRCPAAPKAGHGPCPISGCPAIPADPRPKS